MNATGYTTFQLPTLANPDAIDDVNELRRELHRVNQELLWRTAAYAELQAQFKVAEDSAHVLWKLTQTYRRGRRDHVDRALQRLAAAQEAIEAAEPDETARMH